MNITEQQIIDDYEKHMLAIRIRVQSHIFAIQQMDKNQLTLNWGHDVEVLYLQCRMICEHLIYALAVANAKDYTVENIIFGNDNHLLQEWNIVRICKKLKNINENYFPDSAKWTAEGNLESKNTMTVERFIEIYEQCGKMLHAHKIGKYNFTGSKDDIKTMVNEVDGFIKELCSLLNVHITNTVFSSEKIICEIIDNKPLVRVYFTKVIKQLDD